MALLLTYFVSSFVVNLIYFMSFSKRYQLNVTHTYSLLFLILVSGIICIFNLLQLPFLNLITSFITIIMIKRVLYKIPVRKNNLDDLILYIFIVLLDCICYFLSNLIIPSIHPIEQNIIRTNISTILMLFLGFFIMKYHNHNSSYLDYISLKEFILVLSSSIANIFLLRVLDLNLNYFRDEENLFLIPAITLILISLNLSLIYEIIKRNYESRKNELVELKNKELEYKLRYYKDLNEQFCNSRKIIHDIRNYINSIKILVDDKDYNVANKICDQLLLKIESTNLKYHFKNNLLNVILYEKSRLCLEKGIDFSIKIDEECLKDMYELDLITIFGNILDNAIEANEFSNHNIKKFIKLRVYEHNKFSIINVQNTCINTLHNNINGITSSKNNHLGLGIENVKTVLEKYDGELSIEIKNNICDVFIYFVSIQK